MMKKALIALALLVNGQAMALAPAGESKFFKFQDHKYAPVIIMEAKEGDSMAGAMEWLRKQPVGEALAQALKADGLEYEPYRLALSMIMLNIDHGPALLGYQPFPGLMIVKENSRRRLVVKEGYGGSEAQHLIVGKPYLMYGDPEWLKPEVWAKVRSPGLLATAKNKIEDIKDDVHDLWKSLLARIEANTRAIAVLAERVGTALKENEEQDVVIRANSEMAQKAIDIALEAKKEAEEAKAIQEWNNALIGGLNRIGE
jgi:hypothetical protein